MESFYSVIEINEEDKECEICTIYGNEIDVVEFEKMFNKVKGNSGSVIVMRIQR